MVVACCTGIVNGTVITISAVMADLTLTIYAIATRLGATPAQVIFCFAIAIGILPLTGTTSAKHMKEDLEAEHLTLSDEEAKHIEKIASGASLPLGF